MLPLLTEPLRWLPRAPAAQRCESSLAGPPPPPPPSTDACRPVNVRPASTAEQRRAPFPPAQIRPQEPDV